MVELIERFELRGAIGWCSLPGPGKQLRIQLFLRKTRDDTRGYLLPIDKGVDALPIYENNHRKVNEKALIFSTKD